MGQETRGALAQKSCAIVWVDSLEQSSMKFLLRHLFLAVLKDQGFSA